MERILHKWFTFIFSIIVRVNYYKKGSFSGKRSL